VAKLTAEWDQRFADAFTATADESLDAASDVLEQLAATYDAVTPSEPTT
jgi:hypothetical protein